MFDAKYRLDSETAEKAAQGLGEPKETDIDKMHVYRDALRTGDDRRFAPAAYVLYPGKTAVLFDDNRIGALPLRPSTDLEDVVAIIRRGLAGEN